MSSAGPGREDRQKAGWADGRTGRGRTTTTEGGRKGGRTIGRTVAQMVGQTDAWPIGSYTGRDPLEPPKYDILENTEKIVFLYDEKSIPDQIIEAVKAQTPSGFELVLCESKMVEKERRVQVAQAIISCFIQLDLRILI